MTPLKVYCLLYFHRHGHDGPFLFPTRVQAEIAALRLALSWLSEIEDREVALRICTLITEGRYFEALGTWQDYQYDHPGVGEPEEMEIKECELEGYPDSEPFQQQRDELAAQALKSWKSWQSCMQKK